MRQIRQIIEDRLRLTQAISAATAEHLRLSQIAGGLMILDMKDAVDRAPGDPRDGARSDNRDALERCETRIRGLEARLAELDGELRDRGEGGQ